MQIHQRTRSRIPPSVHPWTLERTHAHSSIPTSTQPASQPTILASSNQPTSQPSQETIDRSAQFLHGCCRLRATKHALEPAPNLKSIFLISCNIHTLQLFHNIPAFFCISNTFNTFRYVPADFNRFQHTLIFGKFRQIPICSTNGRIY